MRKSKIQEMKPIRFSAYPRKKDPLAIPTTLEVNNVEEVVKDMQRKYSTSGVRYMHYKRWFGIKGYTVKESLHDFGICARVKDFDFLEYECYVPADEEFEKFVVHCVLTEDHVNETIKNRSDLTDFLKFTGISFMDFTLHMEITTKLYYMAKFYDICEILGIENDEAIHVDDLKLSYAIKNNQAVEEHPQDFVSTITDGNPSGFADYVVNKLKRNHDSIHASISNSFECDGLFQKKDKRHTKFGVYTLFFNSFVSDYSIDESLYEKMNGFVKKGFSLYFVVGVGGSQQHPKDIYSIDFSKMRQNTITSKDLSKYRDSWLSLCYD